MGKKNFAKIAKYRKKMTWSRFDLLTELFRFHPHVWVLSDLEMPLFPPGNSGKKTAAIFQQKLNSAVTKLLNGDMKTDFDAGKCDGPEYTTCCG